MTVTIQAALILPTAALCALLACDGVESKPSSQTGELLCGAEAPCPEGQFCFNGLCALGCNSNDDCADDQYCDTDFDRLCHNKTVSTCPDTPCAENQICKDGFCSTAPTDTDCTPRPDGQDGCDAYSVCLEEEDESTKCYSFPPCPESGVCPTGTVGAVCNSGIIPNKAHICLTGLCQQQGNCPANWACIKAPTDVVGMCSDGSRFSPCSGASDCQPGLQCDDFLGICM